MLQIYIYENVPFQRDHKNVIYFANASAVLSYLESYQTGVMQNINKFFSNETFIDLPYLYEGANYICIYDDRSNKPYKFFFVDNVYFVSGSCIRYEITLDFWCTYSYDVTMYKSRLTCGHLDALLETPNDSTVKRSARMKLSGDNSVSLTNYLTQPFNTTQNASLIAICSTSALDLILTCQITSFNQVNQALRMLSTNEYEYLSVTYTFEIMKVVIINNFDFISQLNSTYDYTEIEIGSETSSAPTWYSVSFASLSQSSSPFQFRIASRLDFTSYNTFKAKTNKLKNEYFIGTMTTNEKLTVTSETASTMSLYLNIFGKNQIAIYLIDGNIKINLTNDFEIPFKNDSFTLYMAQNQATIEASNRANASQLAMSIGTGALSVAMAGYTGGASLMMGASMLSNVSSTIQRSEQMNARLKDLQKRIDRTDALYSAGIMTLLYGSGVFTVTYDNTQDFEEDLNLYGCYMSTYIDTFKPYDTTDLNFYFVQYDEVNINGNFTYNVKKSFEDLFNAGVRIWTSESNYLLDVDYLED